MVDALSAYGRASSLYASPTSPRPTDRSSAAEGAARADQAGFASARAGSTTDFGGPGNRRIRDVVQLSDEARKRLDEDQQTRRAAPQPRQEDTQGPNFSQAIAKALTQPFQGAYQDLSNRELAGQSLRDANLRQADLTGANLAGSDLRGADLSGANLTDANLYGADLRGTNLQNAQGVGSDILASVRFDRSTFLPVFV